MIGHNQVSFDSVVEETLIKGVYLTQLNAITRAIRDPRLRSRHLQVLAQIIERTNVKTGMAYPGRARMAADITYYVNGEPKHYSEATIATTISELIECGYIMADKRAAEGGGRALSHYATVAPSIEDLQREITLWCDRVKAQPKRGFPAQKPEPDVDAGINVSQPVKEAKKNPDVNGGVNVSGPEVDTSVNVDTGVNVDTVTPADVDTGVPTVTGKGTGSTPPKPGKKAATSRTKLPEDWSPAPATIAWARSNYHVNDQQIADQAEKFHAFHFGKGSRMADWPAAWRNWWLNGFHKHPRRRKSGATSASLPLSNLSAHERAAAEEFTAAIERARLQEEEEERCRKR